MCNEILSRYWKESIFYTEDRELWEKMSRWKNHGIKSEYYHHGRVKGVQFVIPNAMRKRVAKLGGINIPKSEGRVRRAKENLKLGKSFESLPEVRPAKIPTPAAQSS
jgi:hypothetical protein